LPSLSLTDHLTEDKSRPIVVCEDIVIDCKDDYHPDLIGYPTVYDAICSNGTLTFSDEGELGTCGEGEILRTWYVDGLAECIQRITLSMDQAFDPYQIKWPKHHTGESLPGVRRECELWVGQDGEPVLDNAGNEQYKIVEYNEDVSMGDPYTCIVGESLSSPTWCTEPCNIIAASFEPFELIANDACKKIVRRWTVIDWCTWEENSDNPDDDNDTPSDAFQAVDDEWLDRDEPQRAGKWLSSYQERSDTPILNYPDGGLVTDLYCESCPKPNKIAEHVYLRYTRVEEDGFYTYDQVIKVIDETPPVLVVPTSVNIDIVNGASDKEDDFDECVGSQMVTASLTDLCNDVIVSDQDLVWTVVVLSNTGGVAAGPFSLHGDTVSVDPGFAKAQEVRTIVWTAQDACGNAVSATTIVNYVDTKPPTPVCIQDLSTAVIRDNSTAVIWAKDYDRGSFDNCGPVDIMFRDEDGEFVPALDISCDYLSDGISEIITLELYAVDQAGNFDFCNVTLTIEDNLDACPHNVASATIQGRVSTSKGMALSGAMISANNRKEVLTDEEGRYAFGPLPMYTDYRLIGDKQDDYSDGITTLDLVLIQRHLLGSQLIKDPYLLMAADVNMDERVSITDLTQIRSLLLGQIESFSGGKSWLFIDPAYTFEDPANPWPFA